MIFLLPVVNQGIPPLPPNKPYCQPLKYTKYVKDFDPNVHVRVFKIVISVNGETKDAKIVNLFSFTLKNTLYDWCKNHMGCRNPSLGLAAKAKGLQGCGPRGSPGVTSHTPGSVRKCEGMNAHTPKATPTLGDGVPMDSQNFKEQF